MTVLPREEVVPVASELSAAAWAWNVDHLDEYDPLQWTDRAERHGRHKAFSELSMCLHLYRQLRDASDRVAPLEEHVVETVNDRRFYGLLGRHPERLLSYGIAFAAARDFGELSRGAETVLERTLSRRALWARERLPSVELNLYYTLRHLGHDAERLDPETILAYSNARNRPNVVAVERRQAYALTHDVYFYTNYGVEAPGFPATTVPSDLSTTLAGLTLRFMAAGDTDAVAELLLAGIIQRQLAPGFVRLVLSWLRAAADGRETVPGPGIRESTGRHDNFPAEPDRSLDGMDDASERWLKDYHTVLVSGKCFAVLAREWESLVEAGPTRELEHAAHAEELLALGELVRSLAAYRLEDGAAILEELAETAVARAYADVYDTCVEFLRAQRTEDDHVGFFPNERHLYERRGGSAEEFDRELRASCTERCEAAIEAAGRRPER